MPHGLFKHTRPEELDDARHGIAADCATGDCELEVIADELGIKC